MGPLAALIPILGPAIAAAIGKFIPDTDKANQAAFEITKALQDLDAKVIEGQIAINAAEATNPSLFVSGWRPSIGWACSFGFWMAFVIGPFLYWAAEMAYWIMDDFKGNIPMMELDTSNLLALGGSMLGLAGIRSFEKKSGVARK